QDALALCDAFANLHQQVIDLPFGWAYTDLWVDKAGWADDLFDDGIAMLIFVGTRSRGDEERLVDLPLEFCECQWSIFHGRRQAEAVINKHLLARTVASKHSTHLRQHDMGLVHDEQVVIGQVVHQSPWLLSCCASRQVARVVLNAGAEAGLAQHL